MARPQRIDYDRLSPFARWLVDRIEARGSSVLNVAEAADMSVSQLHKIIKSYLPQYSSYQRPGYEKTKAIGEYLGDVQGALLAAKYEAEGELSPEQQKERAVAILNRMPRRLVEAYEGDPVEALDPLNRIIDNVFDMVDKGIIPTPSGKDSPVTRR